VPFAQQQVYPPQQGHPEQQVYPATPVHPAVDVAPLSAVVPMAPVIQPVASAPAIQPVASAPAQFIEPPSVDYRQHDIQYLEKMLQYHKEAAWKIEREIMDKKMSQK